MVSVPSNHPKLIFCTVKTCYILLLIFVVVGCSIKQSEKSSNPGDSVSAIPIPVEEEGEAPPDFSTPITQLASFVSDKDILITPDYVSILDLKADEANLSGEFHSSLAAQNVDESGFLLVLHESLSCTGIACDRLHTLFFFNSAEVSSRQKILINYQEKLHYAILHKMFVLIEAKLKNYEENEEGAMIATDAPATYLREYAAVIENQIVLLSKLDQEKLMLCRNYLFARLGYQFPEENLRKYFEQFSWYQPTYSQIDDKLTVDDQNLLEQIRNLENTH